jgi:hypothetical protein
MRQWGSLPASRIRHAVVLLIPTSLQNSTSLKVAFSLITFIIQFVLSAN